MRQDEQNWWKFPEQSMKGICSRISWTEQLWKDSWRAWTLSTEKDNQRLRSKWKRQNELQFNWEMRHWCMIEFLARKLYWKDPKLSVWSVQMKIVEVSGWMVWLTANGTLHALTNHLFGQYASPPTKRNAEVIPYSVVQVSALGRWVADYVQDQWTYGKRMSIL